MLRKQKEKKNAKRFRKKEKAPWRKYHCGKFEHKEDCSDLFKDLDKAEQSLNEEKDNLVLCTIIEDNSKQVQQKWEKVSFADNVKFKIPHAVTLSSTCETSIMFTIDSESLFILPKITELAVHEYYVIL